MKVRVPVPPEIVRAFEVNALPCVKEISETPEMAITSLTVTVTAMD